MANFEATVRVLDITESDAPAARRVVEDQLRAGGFTRWQIVGLSVQGTMVHTLTPPVRRRARRVEVSYAGGGLLVAAVVAWTLWFLWLLTE